MGTNSEELLDCRPSPRRGLRQSFSCLLGQKRSLGSAWPARGTPGTPPAPCSRPGPGALGSRGQQSRRWDRPGPVPGCSQSCFLFPAPASLAPSSSSSPRPARPGSPPAAAPSSAGLHGQGRAHGHVSRALRRGTRRHSPGGGWGSWAQTFPGRRIGQRD